ncbi:lipoprotein [Klebsiella variicola]|uniref:Lipoprotein n=1 Tax=Klebsiella variicola TaxID=244366 RepID=A0A7H4MC20_KLEVA|nr:lipoprotein [Klebsiella variicola]
MKSVRYFTLNYTGFTTAACENRDICALSPASMSFIPINAILKTPRFLTA